jgi:hypothetical protein
MCDPYPLRNWLLAIAAAILSAAVTVIAAAILNGSFWLVYLSPIWMLSAAVFTGLAIVFCGQAMDTLNVLCTCMRELCAGQCNNMRNVLNGARTVLGIQAFACLTVAVFAWFPYAAQPAMWAIIGALFFQVVLIAGAIASFSSLANCARPPV